ncbi:DUF4400 domain-containing protein [Shewanella sp. JNE4-2]|uniref:DUF4400 domain-containing protein n=1 Tax=Shewanella sp. JNE4-2 TaxID=2983532 RepID=UPI002006CF2E|nr:DUF4400 domain-containing protein [Shewanella sp. JNE4-2]MCK7657676.1 DUF4400 domain-containing protein [Shewanella sp. JNE4-2]
MAVNQKTTNQQSTPPAKKVGYKWVIHTVLVCLLLSILIEFGGVLTGTWGSDHSKNTTDEYLQQLKMDTRGEKFLISPASALNGFIGGLGKIGLTMDDFLFEQTALPAASDEDNFTDRGKRRIKELQNHLSTGINIVTLSTICVLIKLGYFLSMLPLLLITISPIFHCGWIERLDRKYRGVRDSDFKLDMAVNGTKLFFAGSVSLYLFLPIFVNPVFVLIPLFTCVAVGSYFVAAHFVKYV